MKSYLKYLIPPILAPKNFNKAFNTIFYKNKNKHYFEYENSFYKRHAFINLAISKFQNCKYLEIGVENNDVFNSIPLKAENKFGVDPVSGGNFRMTSDKFFQDNKNIRRRHGPRAVSQRHEDKRNTVECKRSARFNTTRTVSRHASRLH